MKKYNSLESKHVQSSRNKFGTKQYPHSPYKVPPVVCEGVTRWDISQYCLGNVTFTHIGVQGVTITTTANVPAGQIWYYNGWEEPSEKDKTIKDLLRIATANLPDQYDMNRHWILLEQGMVKEWELRQTKLYRAMK